MKYYCNRNIEKMNALYTCTNLGSLGTGNTCILNSRLCTDVSMGVLAGIARNIVCVSCSLGESNLLRLKDPTASSAPVSRGPRVPPCCAFGVLSSWFALPCFSVFLVFFGRLHLMCYSLREDQNQQPADRNKFYAKLNQAEDLRTQLEEQCHDEQKIANSPFRHAVVHGNLRITLPCGLVL